MRIRDVMTEALVVVPASTTLGEALRTLDDHDIRHLPVVSRDELVGIVSDRDLRPFYALLQGPVDRWAQELARPVSQVMRGHVMSVLPDDPLTAAIDLMLEFKIGAVAVVDPADRGQLMGIVSYVDVLRALRPGA